MYKSSVTAAGNISMQRAIILISIFMTLLLNGRFLAMAADSWSSIQSPLDVVFKQEENAVLLRNESNIVPLRSLHKGKFALLVIGDAAVFTERIHDYLEMPVFTFSGDDPDSPDLINALTHSYDRIVIAIAAVDISDNTKETILSLTPGTEKIIVFLAEKEYLKGWKGIENSQVLLLAGDNSLLAQDISAQIIFGGIGATGKLKHPVAGMFEPGEGLRSEGGIRLKYTITGEEGFVGQRLAFRIDSIVEQAIAAKAFPGCQVFMAYKGTVLFRKSYGYHTYNLRNKVKDTDLYDLASVTKISGPLPLLMQMDGNGLIDLDKPFSTYWPDWQTRFLRRSNKDTLTLRQLLTHQGRLTPYLHFWRDTKRDDRFNTRLYRHERLDGFSLEVDDHLILANKFKNNVYRSIRRSDLMPGTVYRYSCLSFIIYPAMISMVTGQDYEQLLYQSVYAPIGASRLVYNPLHKGFSREEIPPTEEDTIFRYNLVHGRVHDEAAAVMGGISGNAGLFANAGDLAKLMHLYLGRGNYGGEQLIPAEIMDRYTQSQYSQNRRAIGFDKPLPDNALKTLDTAWPAPGASANSFGHSGFTGTFVWIDPDCQLVYIFLSNRVHPTRENNAISVMNVRTAIHQVFYEEIKQRK